VMPTLTLLSFCWTTELTPRSRAALDRQTAQDFQDIRGKVKIAKAKVEALNSRVAVLVARPMAKRHSLIESSQDPVEALSGLQTMTAVRQI
jgi:hypothetical protein